jgi:hypothetical protein
MLKWLLGFFNRPTYATPPTEKQLGYARKLGIKIPEGIDREGLSELIRRAEDKNPAAKANREERNKQVRIKDLGRETIEQEEKWEALAEANKWMMVVFSKGSSKHAEIVRINGTCISKMKKLILETEIVELDRDSDMGECLEIDKYLEIPLDRIKWFEIINEIDLRNTKQFKTLAERLQKQLQEIKLAPPQ